MMMMTTTEHQYRCSAEETYTHTTKKHDLEELSIQKETAMTIMVMRAADVIQRMSVS